MIYNKNDDKIRSRIYTKIASRIFLFALDVSSQLLSVTKNDLKINRPILINSEFILFIINLINSKYAYSNLNLEF